MKILNLYAGIGGNRELWGNEHQITAVEIEPSIAKSYAKRFPSDKVITGDAHRFLEKHFDKFDFIWSSPPCPTHSRVNNFLSAQGIVRFPDMKLYEEIILLQNFAECKWVVENVKSYYLPLIEPQICGRHYLWANFHIQKIKVPHDFVQFSQKGRASNRFTGIKPQPERNKVNPKLGLHILRSAIALDSLHNYFPMTNFEK